MIPSPGRSLDDTVVQMTALGVSARCFLGPHFHALKDAGYRPVLMSADDTDARQIAAAWGIAFEPIPIKQHIAPLSDLACLYRVWITFRRLQPRVVHAHMSKAGFLGMIGARLAGVSVRVYHSHGMAAFSSNGPRRWLLSLVEKTSCRLATTVLFCSPSTLQAATELGLIPESRGRVLGHGTISGVDPNRFSPEARHRNRAAVRSAWGVDHTNVVVGFVGRIVPHKGIVTLIAAWRCLEPAVRERAQLALFGVYRDESMRELVEDSLAGGIHVAWYGWQEDMPAVYSGLDLLVLPSWHEGFPYSVLEAQCMGLPVIATRVTGTMDAVTNEETGLLVPVGDPHALAKAIGRMIVSPDLREKYGAAARERVLRHFTQEHVTDLHMRFYHEVAPLSG
jgi:glycosyltransferase involved in cell wall biosynthesis